MQLQCSQEVTNMGVSSVRMSEEEEKIIRAYCELHGLSISTALKQALLEKIEDEYDYKCAEKALEEFKKDPTTYSLEEVMKMAGLDDVED